MSNCWIVGNRFSYLVPWCPTLCLFHIFVGCQLLVMFCIVETYLSVWQGRSGLDVRLRPLVWVHWEGNTSCVAEETRTSPATPQEEKRQFCLPVIPEGDRWEPCMTCCSCEEEQVTLDLVGFRLFMLWSCSRSQCVPACIWLVFSCLPLGRKTVNVSERACSFLTEMK